jgi:hypothetical protein
MSALPPCFAPVTESQRVRAARQSVVAGAVRATGRPHDGCLFACGSADPSTAVDTWLSDYAQEMGQCHRYHRASAGEVISVRAFLSSAGVDVAFVPFDGWAQSLVLMVRAHPFSASFACPACDFEHPHAPASIPIDGAEVHVLSKRHVWSVYQFLVGRPGAVIPRPILSDPARVHYCAWNVLVIQRRAMCACYQFTLGGHACPVGRSDGVHNLFDTCLAAAWGAPTPEQHRRALRAAFIEHNLQRMLLSARLLLDGLMALPLDECSVLAPTAVTSFAGIAPRLDAMVGRQALVVANVVPAPLPATVVPPVAMPMLPLRALALLPVAPRHGGYQLDSSLGPLSSGSQLFPNGCLPIHFMERPVLMPPPRVCPAWLCPCVCLDCDRHWPALQLLQSPLRSAPWLRSLRLQRWG